MLVEETAAPAATAAEDVAPGDDVDEDDGAPGKEDATTHEEQSLDDDQQVEVLADEDIAAAPQAEDVRPAPGPLGYGSEAPTGTVPVRSALDVQPDEPVVALVRGRWVDAAVVRRDRSSIVVQYTVPGPGFADRQQRVDAERVRRWPLPTQQSRRRSAGDTGPPCRRGCRPELALLFASCQLDGETTAALIDTLTHL